MNKLKIFISILCLSAAATAYTPENGLEMPSDWTGLFAFQRASVHLADYRGFEGTRYSGYLDNCSGDFYRDFDPASVLTYGAVFSTFRILNAKTRLYASIDFRNTLHSDRYRSLEKNFYDAYIAYTDTTEGDILYNGPVINFMFSRQMSDRLTWSLGLDYGVERGIKDVFTRAETRQMNSDLQTALQYSLSSVYQVDFRYRRFHVQSNYEAVKEYTDAQIQTWFGNTIYRMENPGSSVETVSEQDGFSAGGGLRCGSADSPFQVYFFGDYGVETGDSRKGTKSSASDRGHWQRNFLRTGLWFRYRAGRTEWSGFGRAAVNNDWVRSGIYNAVFLERDDSRFSAGLAAKRLFKGTSFLTLSVRAGTVYYDYKDYLAILNFNDRQIEWRAAADLNISPYPVRTIISGFSAERIPLDFTWNMESLTRFSAYAGFENQWNLLRIAPMIRGGIDKPADSDEDGFFWSVGFSVLQ